MRRSLVGSLVVLSLAWTPPSRAAKVPVTGFVPMPGGRLFYEEQGSGPPVVLIHGGMLDHRMWDPQVEALSRRHRVIRYDVAAHGRSPVPDSPWKNFEHLGLLLQALNVQRADLVGLSLGGRIAVDFAIAYPERVRSLILLDPGLPGFPFTMRDCGASSAERYRAKQAGDAAKVADLFLRSWLAGPHRTPAQVAPAVWAQALEMAVPNALGMAEGAELEPPAVGRLGEIRAPVLLIEGELDCEDIHLITALIERRVPGARRAVLPGVAHMPNLERPAEVNRLLLDFLRRPPAPPAVRSPSGPRQERVEVAGGELWVERTGEGEPVVLIHDGIVHAVGWDDVLPALASQFEVIRYDRRGYGRSSAPQAPFSHLADLEAVLAHLAVGKVHLVGSSAGGGLAIDFTLAHSERVSSLTLVGAVVSGFPYTRHMLGRGGHLTALATTDPAEARRYWATVDPYFIAPDSKAVHERVAAILEESPQNLDEARDRFAERASPALSRLGTIHVPTLVLTGEHDIPDVHAHAGAIAGGIADARREVIADAGHMPYLEQPAAFTSLVVGFLQNAPFLAVLDAQGPEAAMRMVRAARAKNRAAVFVPEDELRRRAYRRRADGAMPEAIALLRLNTELFPVSTRAREALGEALLASGDREGAAAAYRQALELDPASANARAALEQLAKIVGNR